VNEPTRLRVMLRGMGAQLVMSFAFLAIIYGTAFAFPITIEPGAYTGQYSVSGRPAVTGATTVELTAGSYILQISGNENGFRFDVDAAGQVSSRNPAAAHGSGSTLVFHTTTVTIDPAGYPGTYSVRSVSPQAGTGPRTVVLLPGLGWYLVNISSGSSFRFAVDAQGTPTPASVTVSVAGQSYIFLLDIFRPQPTNQPPIAHAGSDHAAAEGTEVTLDGSRGYDPDDDPLTYRWTQLAGPPVTLLPDATAPQPTFTTPEVPRGGETLTFQLVVNDGHQDSAPATLNVTITDVNHSPVAEAGADQRVKEGSLVTLDGSQSYDPDQEALAYAWTQLAGPPVALLPDATAPLPVFTAPEVGPEGETLLFELTVIDARAATGSATVTVVVEHLNHAPHADAGPAQTADEGTLVQLNGIASRDPDGDLLTFTWTQAQGTPVTLSGASSATPFFTAPSQPSHSQETLVFRLEVGDGQERASAEVAVTVVDVDAPPDCGLAQVSPAFLWPPDHKLVAVIIGGVSDPDNDQLTLAVTGVRQDEPIQGQGDGDTSPDAVLQGDKVLLRTERSGTGNGRVYRVNFTADDGHGGSCTGAVTVCVPHDRKPGTCIDDGPQYDSTQP
jgi:PKD domain